MDGVQGLPEYPCLLISSGIISVLSRNDAYSTFPHCATPGALNLSFLSLLAVNCSLTPKIRGNVLNPERVANAVFNSKMTQLESPLIAIDHGVQRESFALVRWGSRVQNL